MNLLSKIGSYDLLVEPFHCDFSNHIFLGHLGNHLLNAADFHSNERGYGMDYLNTVHKTWVLSRFVMELDEMPVAYDRITIDTDTRQPVDILAERDGIITQYIETDEPCPIEPFQRVKLSKNGAECRRIVETRYSDVDVNGHINSVKYIEHILNLWGLDFYKTNRLKRFDIAYVAESHYGDLLHLYVEEVAAGEELKEVCRCKVKFVAK